MSEVPSGPGELRFFKSISEGMLLDLLISCTVRSVVDRIARSIEVFSGGSLVPYFIDFSSILRFFLKSLNRFIGIHNISPLF